MIREAAPKEKGYASFRDWPDKSVKERAVVGDLLCAIKAEEGQHGLLTLNVNETDPPDCIGIGLHGERVGFEVTELVDQATVERNLQGRSEWKEWGQQEFLAKLQSILNEKDRKQLRGRPYDKFVVVVHTDEPLLPHSECASMLNGHRFGPYQQINEAFLLFSYEPGRSSYPYIRLKLW
jgi:hypothetical protein